MEEGGDIKPREFARKGTGGEWQEDREGPHAHTADDLEDGWKAAQVKSNVA